MSAYYVYRFSDCIGLEIPPPRDIFFYGENTLASSEALTRYFKCIERV